MKALPIDLRLRFHLLCTAGESTQRQDADRAASRMAFAEKLSVRLRSSHASRQHQPPGTTTHEQRGTLAVPSMLQVSSCAAHSGL